MEALLKIIRDAITANPDSLPPEVRAAIAATHASPELVESKGIYMQACAIAAWIMK